MREVDYDLPLSDVGDVLRTRITVDTQASRGQKVIDFLIQYETTVDGVRVPVVRYDCAHGHPHRDRYDRQGRQTKQPMPEHLSRDDALQTARVDLETNWPRYREEFHRG